MKTHRPQIALKLSRTIMWLAVPIFVVALAIFFNHSNYMIEKEANERSAAITHTSVRRVESYISLVESAARSNLWMLETYFTPDSLQSISRRIVKLNSHVLSCSVSTEPNSFPEVGRYFSVYSVNEGDTIITMMEPDFEYFDRVWYRTAVHSGKPCWVEPFSDFNTGTINYHDAVASYCIPIRPGGGQIAGVVSADFSFKQLSEAVFETEHPYPSSYYMLIGQDGRYLIHPNTNLLFKKTIFTNFEANENPDIIALGYEMTAGKKGTMHVKIDGTVCHVCYEPVPGTNWSLALISPDKEVLSEYDHLTYIIVAVILVGLLLIRWMTNRVVKRNIEPINQLLDATKRMANGYYEEIIPHTNRKDIVSQLQNAFREMQLEIISHMKRTSQTAEDLDAETEELQRLVPEAKEAAARKKLFIQNVSHQIGAPLNVINGLANVLQNNILEGTVEGTAEEREECHKIAKTMKHNAILLHRMMLMLSDSSDTQRANTERYRKNDVISCNEVAQDCIDFILKTYSCKPIQFETDVPDAFKIKTNDLYVKHTIHELLFNAIFHSDGKHVKLRVTQTDDTIRFIIEDKGAGLAPEIQEFIYEPFMKADTAKPGLGLGLPLCKEHAHNLGGDIIYDDSYKEGCRFIFELPKQ